MISVYIASKKEIKNNSYESQLIANWKKRRNNLFCSATDMNNFFVDRVITITGTPETTSKAEALVSEKMRKCFEQDAQNYNVRLRLYSWWESNIIPLLSFILSEFFCWIAVMHLKKKNHGKCLTEKGNKWLVFKMYYCLWFLTNVSQVCGKLESEQSFISYSPNFTYSYIKGMELRFFPTDQGGLIFHVHTE